MKRLALCWLTVTLLLSTPAPTLAEIWIGVHYEYPFGGMMTDRPEWIPKVADGLADQDGSILALWDS